MASLVDSETEFAVTQLPEVRASMMANNLRSSALATVASSFYIGEIFRGERPFNLAPDEWATLTRVLRACPPAVFANHPQVTAAAAVLKESDAHTALSKLLTVHLPLAPEQGGWHDYWVGSEMMDQELKDKVETIRARHPVLAHNLLTAVSEGLKTATY